MDYNYYTLGYHITATLGYLLVAAMAFIAGWMTKSSRTKRKIKEIDGFALYKVMMMQKEKANANHNNGIIVIDEAMVRKQEKERRRQQTFRVFKG